MSRSRKTAWTLFILLVFGIASPVLADPDSQTVYGAPAERPASMMYVNSGREKAFMRHDRENSTPGHAGQRWMSARGKIGRSGDVRFSNRPSGSSTFRLSTTTVSMSLAGSCFSSESAPGPFHHGIRGRGGTIYRAALRCRWQVQAIKRTHLIHRPARDIFPLLGGSRVFSYRV